MIECCLLEDKQDLKLGVLISGEITSYSGLKCYIFEVTNDLTSLLDALN